MLPDSQLDGVAQRSSVVGIPETFDLVLDGHSRQPCRVAWRRLKEIGVEFRTEH